MRRRRAESGRNSAAAEAGRSVASTEADGNVVGGLAFPPTPHSSGPARWDDDDGASCDFNRRTVERDLIKRGGAVYPLPATDSLVFASADLFVRVSGSVHVFYEAGSLILPAHVGLEQVNADVVNGAVVPGAGTPEPAPPKAPVDSVV